MADLSTFTAPDNTTYNFKDSAAFHDKSELFLGGQSTETQQVATFESCADGNPIAVKVGIDAVQDLHGYDYPWHAGGGKNVLPPIVSNSANGITCTVDDEGVVTINGTATALCAFRSNIQNPFRWDGTTPYWLSGCPAGGNASSGYSLRVDSIGANNYCYADTGDGVALRVNTGSLTDVALTYCIVIRSGTVCDNLVFKPQLEVGTEKTSYASYSNICPISGWTGTKITRTDNNIFDPIKAFAEGVTPQSNILRYTMDVPNGTYTVSTNVPIAGTTKSVFATPSNTDASSNSPNNGVWLDNPRSVTVSDGKLVVHIRINVTSSGYALTLEDFTSGTYWIKVEENSVATPYKRNIYNISFPQTAGIVYGGYLEVYKDGSGKLTADWAIRTLDGTNLSFTLDKGLFYHNWSGNPFYVDNVAICSHLKEDDDLGGGNNIVGFKVYNMSGATGRLLIRFDATKQQTMEEFTAYLAEQYAAGTPVQIVYKLATPVEFPMTAAEVNALLTTVEGTNHLWADTGDILGYDYSCGEQNGTGLSLITTGERYDWSHKVGTDENVKNTPANTTKAYLTGTTSATENTGGQVFDDGVYVTTEQGQLNATSYKVNEKCTMQWNANTESLDFVFE